MSDELICQLEHEAAEFAKNEEAIDTAAAMRLATLLREAAAEIRRLRAS